TQEVTDEQTPAHLRFAAPSRRVFADPVAALAAGVRAQQSPMILGLALSEAVAVCGLVYRLMGGELRVSAVFFAVGAALIAARVPRPARSHAPNDTPALGALAAKPPHRPHAATRRRRDR